MGLSISAIDDLILATREHFYKDKGFATIFTEQGYPFMDRMLQKERMKITGNRSSTRATRRSSRTSSMPDASARFRGCAI